MEGSTTPTSSALPVRLAWADRDRLRDVLRDRPLVCIDAGRREPAEIVAVAAALGAIELSPRISFRLEGQPEIMIIGNVKNDRGATVGGSAVGLGFHSDMSYRARPPAWTMLYAITVPERGGDTHFADLYRLYEELDEPTRAEWHDLRVVHDTDSAFFKDTSDRSNVHELTPRHPDSGRRLVFASPAYTKRVDGVSAPTSTAILERIARRLEPPDLVHRWRPGDLMVWDNRAIVHRATPHDPSERRCLWRLSVKVREDERTAPSAEPS